MFPPRATDARPAPPRRPGAGRATLADVPSMPIRPLAAPLGAAAILAHADGFNWDEALMVLAPIAIIAAVLLYVNRKLSLGLADAADDPGDDQAAVGGPDADDGSRTTTTD